MRLISSLAALSVAGTTISAHYTFSGLLVNNQLVGDEWQYVRTHTRNYMPTFREEAAQSIDFRCNQNASSGVNTDVYTVKPGDTVGLRQAYGAGGIEHPGPTQLYMSKAPDSVKEYDGSGDWFKVYQGLVCKQNLADVDLQNDGWCIWGENNISFTVPDTIPDGEYLLRAEHIALHGAHVGRAEFYYACAQIKVQGSSATALPSGSTTRIPGVYGVDDDAINFSIWSGYTEYPYIPGIEVSEGGQIRGTKNGGSGDVVAIVKSSDVANATTTTSASGNSTASIQTPSSILTPITIGIQSTSVASAASVATESAGSYKHSKGRCGASRRRSLRPHDNK